MTKTTNHDSSLNDARRLIVLVLAIGFLAASTLAHVLGGDGSTTRVAVGTMGRLGLVLGALWLAWPSLKRPARWLPPGIAVAIVVALMALAAQPRLLVVAIPALVALFSISVMVRAIRGQR